MVQLPILNSFELFKNFKNHSKNDDAKEAFTKSDLKKINAALAINLTIKCV